MKKFLSILIFIVLIMNISASCNETQININSASVEELDNLTGIGEVYAERIIEARPFGSIDDLVDVDGIGEKTLEKIKQQGLACVDDEEQEEMIIDEPEEIKEVSEDFEELTEKIEEKAEIQPIVLDSQNIKSEEDNSNLVKSLALGGIITFCTTFGALFFFKTRRRKNEFG